MKQEQRTAVGRLEGPAALARWYYSLQTLARRGFYWFALEEDGKTDRDV